MKIYKVTYTKQGASEGFYFSASRMSAMANNYVAGRDVTHCQKKIDVIEVAPTRKDIVRLLNHHASHNDNG